MVIKPNNGFKELRPLSV